MHGRITMNAVLLLLVAAPNGFRLCGDEYRADASRMRRAEVVPIAPGTVIGNRPPKTWSNLVIKSLPRLASGDLGTLPKSAFRTASLIRTVILADVGRSADDPSRFALRRLGIGLCIPDQSRGDVVVDSGRLEETGVRLGMLEKVVLKSAEAELAQGRLIASSPTFALYRGPTFLNVRRVHRRVELTYAFLVDEKSGALRVLLWSEEAGKGRHEAPANLEELKPNLVIDCPLNVKANRLLGTLPVSWSFAMESLPPGQPRPVTPDLRRCLAGDEQRRDLEKLEDALRQALTALQEKVNQGSAGS